MECYAGLGGNIGNSSAVFAEALSLIKESKGISRVRCSQFYYTSPVACESVQLFLNCVITFTSDLPLTMLFSLLERIEYKVGKRAKAKNAPRIIDIDLLFYGTHLYHDEKITIPHPHWHKRLFVVQPLRDLIDILYLQPEKSPFSIPINIQKLLSFLQNQNKEIVRLYENNKN